MARYKIWHGSLSASIYPVPSFDVSHDSSYLEGSNYCDERYRNMNLRVPLLPLGI